MKNEVKNYVIVGQALPFLVRRMNTMDKDETTYSEEHRWPFVIELVNTIKYLKTIPATEAFPAEIIKKLHTQRPSGIELTPEISRIAKEKIQLLLKV